MFKNDKKVCNVYSTTDYSKFKIFKGNRTINLHNLKRIKDSFSEKQLISIVIVNEKYEIIDGQHRFTASKNLGLPVYYIICEGYGLDEIHTLNANSKDWTKKEYLDSYCQLKRKPYLKFKEFMSLFPDLNFMSCYTLLTAGIEDVHKTVIIDGKTKSIRAKAFENGDFEVVDWDFAVDSARKIMMVKPFYEGFKRRSFVAAMIKLFKNDAYNHADLLTKLKYNSVSLVDCNSYSQYLLLIEEIYNYRRSKKVNLRYAA